MKKRINKLTKEKLIKLIEDFGYKTTSQSSDGTYTLIRTPDGTKTDYWLFPDRIEQKADYDNRFTSCSYFNYLDCFALVEDNSLSIIVKGIKHHGVFIIFFNYNATSGGNDE